MKRKAMMIAIVVFVLSLAASAVSAQDGPRRDRPENGIWNTLITAIEEATGLSRQEFVQAIRDGSSAVEIIEANGGDVAAITAQTVDAITARLDEAVANGQITQERADSIAENLETTITAALNGELEGNLRERLEERRRDRADNQVPRELLEVIIAETGLTSFELRDQLQDSTIAEVLAANGADVQVVLDRAVSIITQRLDEAVANGRITQAQADERLQNIEQRMTDWLTGETASNAAA